MRTEYRIIFTATFDTSIERDKAYAVLKAFIISDAMTKSAIFKRGDMTPDDYNVNDTVTEKVI